jgi:hypothetical protein
MEIVDARPQRSRAVTDADLLVPTTGVFVPSVR